MWSELEKWVLMLVVILFGWFVELEEVVELILFLLSDVVLMISGVLLLIDGGYMVC